jgi:hypothetical protein
MTDNKNVVPFPSSDEEKAARVIAEAERLSACCNLRQAGSSVTYQFCCIAESSLPTYALPQFVTDK